MKPTIVPAELAGAEPATDSWLQRLGRRLFLGKLAGLTHGEVTVIEGADRRRFGKRSADFDLHATIEILHPQTHADVAFGGSTGAGEAYMRGHWRSDDLTSLVRIFIRNRPVLNAIESGSSIATAPLRRILHALNRNSPEGSRRNIAAHYDLGNDLFALFLGRTMAYSCGIFEREDSTLDEAQLAKFERICRKLELKPDDHLVEIGAGWGGLAIHAAQKYGCRVTTTTISKEQHHWVAEKIRAAGLSDRITLLMDDYRDLRGQFDKMVSVEMIEAVGRHYLDAYIAQCSRLLKPNGAMLLQAITIRDQLYESAARGMDFIQRFIFPGSFLPSVSVIADSVRRVTDMKVFHMEDIGPHYATTLKTWRENFFARLPDVRRLGYPDAFVRMWDFYLSYCEGGCRERQMGDLQLLLTKPQCRLSVPA
ncbi:MAG TPA: cyclopropane-fatty-acyl-phospholipid synthase family protein [Steroidobacteraceae bacterium]|nr:cyclopropane-fatty-acyl-phospholipid synthase family protein [Steroidobacteraceae bacterium]